MGTLRLKIVHGKELEIEGEAKEVKEMWEMINAKFGVNKADSLRVDNLSTTGLETWANCKAKTEAEWLVAYAYGVGKEEVTKQDLLEAYRRTRRYSENRRKNLSFNLRAAVKRGWLNAVGKGAFALTEQGRAKAMGLVGKD